MAAPSSPIVYPTASSPAAVPAKRPPPLDVHHPSAKLVSRAGIIVEDESDDSDEEGSNYMRGPKRRMLKDARICPDVAITATASATSDEAPEVRAALAELVNRQHLLTHTHDLKSRKTRCTEIEADKRRNACLFDAQGRQPDLDPQIRVGRDGYAFITCSGRSDGLPKRTPKPLASFQHMAAERSRTKEGRAKRAYYGVEIHKLVSGEIDEMEATSLNSAAAATGGTGTGGTAKQSVEDRATNLNKSKSTMLWTEKYRARNFIDLVGDHLTNRQVLRWLKRWDSVVFPHSIKSKSIVSRRHTVQEQQKEEEGKLQRKILMLTGPPGLGKTTLAHVCARQAGYEVLEINASDDRSRDVVRDRIRTSLGTESVKAVAHAKQKPGAKGAKVARPLCVVVDEVDGVTTGSGASGEGGFIRALIDLVMTDQKNSSGAAASSSRRPRKGDDFRQMRPLILICNDVYHPSLKPLRQSGLAEIIRMGKPSVDAVVTRLRAVFEKEGIPCENDAARKLCEAAWGMSNGLDAKRGAESAVEGDLRGVMVIGEWVAGRLRATETDGPIRLTRQWVDKYISQHVQPGAVGARGLGRGGVKDIVSRVFQEGGGFPRQPDSGIDKKGTSHQQPQTQLGFTDRLKKHAIERLREMVDTSGEVDRIVTEIFSEYPNRDFNDDLYLSKPDEAHEWLNFHDTCSSRLFSSQEWELAPYLSQPVLACHHLFASPYRHHANAGYDKQWQQWRTTDAQDNLTAAPLPFTGPRADYMAHETVKQNRAVLQGLQGQLPPSLMRAFRSPEDIATNLLPYVWRMVSPDVKPVVVGGSSDKGFVASVRRQSEKDMVKRAAGVLAEVGISLVKGKMEDSDRSMAGRTQWIYRMDPDIEALSTFETAGMQALAMQVPVRYAVRQVLDQELQKTIAFRDMSARQTRFNAGVGHPAKAHPKEQLSTVEKTKATAVPVHTLLEKKDFFGRVVVERPLHEIDGICGRRTAAAAAAAADGETKSNKVWVTYHEGLNNAVRKPVTLENFIRGL